MNLTGAIATYNELPLQGYCFDGRRESIWLRGTCSGNGLLAAPSLSIQFYHPASSLLLESVVDAGLLYEERSPQQCVFTLALPVDWLRSHYTELGIEYLDAFKGVNYHFTAVSTPSKVLQTGKFFVI